MTRAQFRGIIDYSTYKRYDINWRRREDLLLNELEKELVTADKRDFLAAYSALYAGSEFNFEAQSTYHKQLFSGLQAIRSISLPWIKTQEEHEQEIISEASKRWDEFQDYKKTDSYQSRREHSKAVFGKIYDDEETDRKLMQLRESATKRSVNERKIINRVPFNG